MRLLHILAPIVLLASVSPNAARADPNELLITITVSGAVNRTGAYPHAQDNTHLCRPRLEIPPLPTPGAQFTNLPFTIDFNAGAMPPDARFVMQIDEVPYAPGHNTGSPFKIAMTAGGHVWTGETPPLQATIALLNDAKDGTFRIAGLTSQDAPGTLTVAGKWHCPK
jgi:hypothetical protein